MSQALPLTRHATWPRLPGGLSISGALSLLAVIAVLIVVSVPRLRDLAQAENEADALGTTQLLATGLRTLEVQAKRQPALRELLRRPELAGVLGDAEILAHGRLLRRRGYLFEITRLRPTLSLPSASLSLLSGQTGFLKEQLAVRAWPWAHGATGESSFLVTSAGKILSHPNSGPHWQGVESAGVDLEQLSGWQPTR